MHTRRTRSNKLEELLNLTNQELAHLERTNRKAKKPVEMVNHIVLIRGEDGLLFDPEGNRYNEQGQKLDAAGNVIPEPAVDPAAPNPPPPNPSLLFSAGTTQ
ncbi:unnamed protein product [Microthlaspi erraticum]|uniref:VPS37 C-terminal domain-containing protein n=1 Tax=Microthlaspi erraticum TaxID=1685480 RepID=A0A6D2ILA9_9BRAS|nr:unnamed protein product [Microthlaspi erraticum]